MDDDECSPQEAGESAQTRWAKEYGEHLGRKMAEIERKRRSTLAARLINLFLEPPPGDPPPE